MASRPAAEEGSFAPPRPAVPLQSCPIEASLGTLGRKWTLTIIRDIAFYPGIRFSSILRNNRGLRQRTLSLRLKQLSTEGLIHRQHAENGGHRVQYELTPTGRQVWPVLAALVQFGVRNFPRQVFADGQPRDIEEVFPGGADLMLDHLAVYARESSGPPAGTTRGSEVANRPRSAKGRA